MTKFELRSGRRPGAGVVRSESDWGRPGRRASGERTTGGFGRRLLVAAVVICLLSVPSVGFAGSKAADTSRESGLGAAAAISSLVYGPVKLVYAIGGLVVGGCAWAFTAGDTEVATTVFTRSLRGTYVITPEILLGEERLEFIGRDLDDEPVRTETVAAATPAPVAYEDSGYDEMGW